MAENRLEEQVVWLHRDELQAQKHPKNPNKHPKEQIERLAEVIRYQGWRQPIIVSKRSGLIVAGHGRLEAAQFLDSPKVPVIYQNFDSDEQEYACIVSDNAIAAWASLDLAAINAELPSLGPDFTLDHLGLRDFILEPAELPTGSMELSQKDFENFNHICPRCNFEFSSSKKEKDG